MILQELRKQLPLSPNNPFQELQQIIKVNQMDNLLTLRLHV